MKNIVGEALKEGAEAVNNQGGFGGKWRCAVSYTGSDVSEKIHKAIHSSNAYYH